MISTRGEHWEAVYGTKATTDVSWYEATPEISSRLVLTDGVPARVVDVGAGASGLAAALLEVGVAQVTLVDLSATALAQVVDALGERRHHVTAVVGDVLECDLPDDLDAWHDRAVFHFLVEVEQRATYVARAAAHLRPGGLLVVGTFAADGPEQCSGLPTARYDAEALAAEFARDFDVVTSERIEHRTPWGAIQPFTWVVLRRR